jgi:hypothetical protein
MMARESLRIKEGIYPDMNFVVEMPALLRALRRPLRSI